MLAGGIAGGLFGIGWGITVIAAFFTVIVALLGGLLALFFGGADVTGGLGVIVLVIALVALAIGILLVIASVIISLRILRKGNVNRPAAVTWLSLLIVLIINTIAQRIADPWITAGGDADVEGWQRFVAGLVLVIVAIGAGVGTWLLLANAFRSRTPATSPTAVGSVPIAPISPPEPPTSTLGTPPPAPPPTPAA